MTEPNPSPRPFPPVRVPVLMGLFAGTAVGGGYLLAGIPNVEVMSLIVAVSGAVLGAARGFAVGALAAAVFSLGSPYGLPAPLLLAAQMLGLGAAGAVGRLARGPLDRPRTWVLGALAGIVITIVFDLLTNLAIIGSLDLPLPVVLAGALPFFLLHAGSNAVIFASLFAPLAASLRLLAQPRVTGRQGPPPGPVAAVAFLVLLGAGPAGAADPDAPALDAPANGAPANGAPAAPPDTLAAAADSLGGSGASPSTAEPASPHGWKRPLWEPFTPTFLAWVDRDAPWLAWVDGGIGATAVLRGEAGAGAPLVVRDGVPLGTGHVLADDPWLIGREGVTAAARGLGLDGWGGTGGLVELASRDGDPGRSVSSYRGIKGRHESYYRGVEFRSQRAEWRLGFTFEESLDNEGYNHTADADEQFTSLREDGFPAQGKVRQSRTRLERLLPGGNSLSIEFGMGRRTRDELPVLDAGSLEAWDRNAAVRMRWRAGDWDLRPVFFWNERDVQWGSRWAGTTPPSNTRLLETGRQGLRIDVRRSVGVATAPAAVPAPPVITIPDSLAAGAAAADDAAPAAPAGSAGMAAEVAAEATPDRIPLLSFAAGNWSLHDTGTAAAWAGGEAGPAQGRGDEWRLALGGETALAGARLGAELGALGGGGFALGPDVRLGLKGRGRVPGWQAQLEWGGRAPRSDEMLTPLLASVAGGDRVLLPSPGLEREKTLRANVVGRARALGLELALDAAARRLQDGITWRAEADDPDRGRWANDLGLNSWRVTAGAARSGRFLGWLRLKAEGTWQGFEVTAGQPGALPPKQWQRLRLDWENHFFQEDGVLQVSLVTTRRGPGADPWDVAGTTLLPARVNHDLLLGFRLVGAHLVVGLRNLAGDRQRLSSGALSPGQELDLRLEWAFNQ